MAINYSFIDSNLYGTEDINDITRSLTGAGVAPFASKDSYNVSDLNNMTSALVDSGVSLDGCKCSAENIDTADMTVTVDQGIVFFESGVRLEVDDEGYKIGVTPNTAGYIYAHYSPSLQKADILFAEDLPTDGEIVLLAELLADGSVRDKRTFARSKIATLGSNATIAISEDRITVYETYAEAPSYSETEKIIAEIDLSGIDITKFNYLIYQYPCTTGGSTDPEICEKYFDLKNSTRAKFYVTGSLYYWQAKFDIILEANRMVVVVDSNTTFNHYKNVFKETIPYFRLV